MRGNGRSQGGLFVLVEATGIPYEYSLVGEGDARSWASWVIRLVPQAATRRGLMPHRALCDHFWRFAQTLIGDRRLQNARRGATIRVKASFNSVRSEFSPLVGYRAIPGTVGR